MKCHSLNPLTHHLNAPVCKTLKSCLLNLSGAYNVKPVDEKAGSARPLAARHRQMR